jgi:hypothetical protein
MNFYKLHDEPESIHKYQEALDKVVDVFWHKYKNDPVKLKEREPEIAKSAKYSYAYAFGVLHKRFPAGEAAISKVPQTAYNYAKNIIQGPWPEGEDAIGKESYFAYYYVEEYLRKKFPKGEAAIAKDPYYAAEYARITGQPFKAGEKAIATNNYASYIYARDVLKKPWKPGEAAILNDKDGTEYSENYMKFCNEWYANQKKNKGSKDE